jgi:hypothetical protein
MAGRAIEMPTGQECGRWVVIERGADIGGKRAWKCRCTCGTERIVLGKHLRSGRSASCGCLVREVAAATAVATGARNMTHGARAGGNISPEYRSWSSMRSRCSNPHATGLSRYGGRGVRVCDRWNSFANFLADMGPRPLGCSLDRYPDVNGDYVPSNVRWATAKDQIANRRPFQAPHGETHSRSLAKLTWAQVNEIRGLAASLSRDSLAKRYGVAANCIRDIVRGHTWRTSDGDRVERL